VGSTEVKEYGEGQEEYVYWSALIGKYDNDKPFHINERMTSFTL
jgi:hypothetical protein